jgi:hypothetical protein
MTLLGWTAVDPITTRMVAAALFDIRIESFFSRYLGKDAFIAMLRLKAIWASAAVLGISWSLVSGLFGYLWVGMAFLGIFLGFKVLWVYLLLRVNRGAQDS